MTYTINEHHDIIVTKDSTGYRVDFMEDGRRLGSEVWAELDDVLWYYGI